MLSLSYCHLYHDSPAEREGMRSSQVFLLDSTVLSTFSQRTEISIHVHTLKNEEICPIFQKTGPLAALSLFVLLQKKEKPSRKCAEPAATSQPIPRQRHFGNKVK